MTLADIIAALKADRELCLGLSRALVHGERGDPLRAHVACWVRIHYGGRDSYWTCEPVGGPGIAWVTGGRVWWKGQKRTVQRSLPTRSEADGIRMATEALEAQGWTIHPYREDEQP